MEFSHDRDFRLKANTEVMLPLGKGFNALLNTGAYATHGNPLSLIPEINLLFFEHLFFLRDTFTRKSPLARSSLKLAGWAFSFR